MILRILTYRRACLIVFCAGLFAGAMLQKNWLFLMKDGSFEKHELLRYFLISPLIACLIFLSLSILSVIHSLENARLTIALGVHWFMKPSAEFYLKPKNLHGIHLVRLGKTEDDKKTDGLDYYFCFQEILLLSRRKI